MAMGLIKENESNGNNEIYDRLNFNAKDGKFTHHHYDRDNECSVADPYKDEFKIVIDFNELKVGWADWTQSPPSVVIVPHGVSNQLPERPSPDHKEYFNVNIYNKNLDTVKFGSSASSVIQSFDKLHDSYISANQKEKLPVVQVKGVVGPTKWGKATVYLPDWEIVDWVERPENMKTTNNTETASQNSNETKSVEKELEKEIESYAPKKELEELTDDFDADF